MVRRGRLPEHFESVLLLWIVFDPDRILSAGFQMDANLIVGSEPPLPPMIHDQLSIEPHAESAIRVGPKLVVARCRRKNGTCPRESPSSPLAGDHLRMLDLSVAGVQMNRKIRCLSGRLRAIGRRHSQS